MSGHSKWSTIKHKKALVDAKRSGVFTRMANAISVAVRKGGGIGDPDMNFSLRLAVDKARAVNMPKENIERAIDKGMGTGGEKEFEEILLEGYGPHGVALIIETVTNNHNRTVAEIKNILEKKGGSLGEPGSVTYLFDKVGEVVCTGTLSDELELELIDLGMTDFETEGDEVHIYCPMETMRKIVEYLKENHLTAVSGSIVYKAKMTVDMTEHAGELDALLESIHDDEDVQEVHLNAIW